MKYFEFQELIYYIESVFSISLFPQTCSAYKTAEMLFALRPS